MRLSVASPTACFSQRIDLNVAKINHAELPANLNGSG
jgi:hypothetical protein